MTTTPRKTRAKVSTTVPVQAQTVALPVAAPDPAPIVLSVAQPPAQDAFVDAKQDRPRATPPDWPKLEPVLCDLVRIEHARKLPEVFGSIEQVPVAFAPGAIERFYAGEHDRRVMEVIATEAGLAQRAVSE